MMRIFQNVRVELERRRWWFTSPLRLLVFVRPASSVPKLRFQENQEVVFEFDCRGASILWLRGLRCEHNNFVTSKDRVWRNGSDGWVVR